MVAAIKAQVDTLAYAHTSFFTTEVSETLARTLAEAAPGDLDHVYFVSGGSEAVEAALKLARQYFVETGEPQRRHFIARRQSYHGNTLGALAIGGNAWRREPFLPLLVPAHHVSPCYAYRDQAAGETDAQYAQRLADELEAKILELGPESVAAFVAETVVGATAGAVPPVSDYLKRIRAVCDKYGVLLILDEVMSGMGRTGHLFACAEDGVVPDIVTIAKGLGAGYQPIGAMMSTRRIYEKPSSAAAASSSTATPISATPRPARRRWPCSRPSPRTICSINVLARGEQLRARLREALARPSEPGRCAWAWAVRRRGVRGGPRYQATLDPARKTHALLKRTCMEHGVLVYPMGGTVDGVHGDHVLFAPPFICTAADIDHIVDRFAQAVRAVLPA